MKRVVLLVLGFVAIVAVGVYAWFMISSGDGQASQEISAPELEAADAETIVYRIVSEESEVRFSIGEVLRGEPFTAVGRTTDVAGDIAVNTQDPAASEVGTIRINARTLATDNDQRNRALRSFILRSAEAEFEFMEFVPTQVTGLPESVTQGEPFTFQITGDLTVAGVTNSVTFDATVTQESDERLSGSASATVLYPDFNLTVPNSPMVASVEDEVLLEIDFVAQAVTDDATTPEAEETEAA